MISPIPIDYNLIASLGSSYADQQLKAQKMQEMEQERVVKALQMQQLMFKLDEEKRARAFQTGLSPYIDEQTTALQQRRAGMEEPQPTMYEPQGPPAPVIQQAPEAADAGMFRSLGIGKPTGEVKPLEAVYEPPDQSQMLQYNMGVADTIPNRWKMAEEYALKQGRIEEAMKFGKLALTGEFRKIDAKLNAAQAAGNGELVQSLLSQRRNLEMEAINQENKMGEYLISREKNAYERGKVTEKGMVDIGGGRKAMFLVDAMGRGFVDDPEKGRIPFTPTGGIEPLVNKEPGNKFAMRVEEYVKSGMTRQAAMNLVRAEDKQDLMDIGNTRIPSFTADPRLPAPMGLNRRTGRTTWNGVDVPEHLVGQIPLLQANYKSDLASIQRFQGFSDLNDQAVVQATNNLKAVQDTSLKYNRFNIPAPNRIGNWLTYQAGSAEQQAAYGRYQIAILAFAREYMKVVTNSARTPTELSVQAQQMVDKLFKTSDTWAAMEAKLEQAAVEMANTTKSYDVVGQRIRARLSEGPEAFYKKMSMDPKIEESMRRHEALAQEEARIGSPSTPPPPREKFGGRTSLTDPVTGDIWDLVNGYPVYMGKANFGRRQ